MRVSVEPVVRDGVTRRDSIVRAAIDVFAARGYGGASLREIAATAGIEKGHLTYYFPEKEALLFEIVDDLHELFAASIHGWAGPEDDPPEVRLRAVLEAHVGQVLARCRQTQVAYENFRFLAPARRTVIIAKRDAYERALAALIDACRPDGTIADEPTAMLTKVVSGILNWPYHWYTPTGRLSAQEVRRLVARRARAALAP